MKIEHLKKVCMAGGGVMGRQIGLNTAIHGYETALFDSNPIIRASVAAWVREYLDARVAKGRMTREEADAAAGRLHIAESLEEGCRGAQLVIEAIVEDREAKRGFFAEVSRVAPEDAVLATNSSYMVSSLFADAVKNPGRLANLHYFTPALVMKLVEVVQGPHTSEETARFLTDFARSTGKTPVLLTKEVDGFIVNSILRAEKDQAYRLLEAGIASVEDIDTAVELGLNHPLGPFRLTDLTGIDINWFAYERRRLEKGEIAPGYEIVKAKYEAGELGKKSKKGYYTYE